MIFPNKNQHVAPKGLPGISKAKNKHQTALEIKKENKWPYYDPFFNFCYFPALVSDLNIEISANKTCLAKLRGYLPSPVASIKYTLIKIKIKNGENQLL